MKPSEKLFRFPIVAYDGVELQKRMDRELNAEAVLNEGVQPYVIGYARIPLGEIRGWHDGWRKGVSIQSIKDDIKAGKKGFDSTMVLTESLGDYHCSWNMEKFEKNYDAHYELIEAPEQEEMEQQLEALAEKMNKNSNPSNNSGL